MRPPRLAALALAAALGAGAGGAAAQDDSEVAAARAALSDVLLFESAAPERAKAVAALGGLDRPAAAAALLECLRTLAVRTAEVEARAARTREDYRPYEGTSFTDKREWQIKERLAEQMRRQDATLRGDGEVYDAFAATAARFAHRDAIALLVKAALGEEPVHARRALLPGLLRNPGANAGELGRKAMADSDAGVRLLALDAFADRKDPSHVDLAAKALADPGWPVRQAAAKALAAIGDMRAVAPLVAAIAAEDGRVVEDLAQALAALTGQNLGPNPDSWKRWFDEHKGELGQKAVKPGRPARSTYTPPVDYYGVQTRSKRIVFVIDVSGSMTEVLGYSGVTTGDQFVGPKIEIAKRVLNKAIAQLSQDTWFNVVAYSTNVRKLHETMVQASPQVKHATRTLVEELQASGATYTYGALKTAFEMADPEPDPARRTSDGSGPLDPAIDTIFLLSDGAPTELEFKDREVAKLMDPQIILDAVKLWNRFRRVQVHTIAIDPRIEKTGRQFIVFMRALAESNRGTCTEIGSTK